MWLDCKNQNCEYLDRSNGRQSAKLCVASVDTAHGNEGKR